MFVVRRVAGVFNLSSTRPSTLILTCRMVSNDKSTDVPCFDMDNPFEKERIQCVLCKLNITPDFKNIRLLSQFQSQYTGRIYGRHITGLCKHKQEAVEKEIKKAQLSGLMPIYHKHINFMKDTPLFDPENPVRPHKY